LRVKNLLDARERLHAAVQAYSEIDDHRRHT
jgi:hypothetical protein